MAKILQFPDGKIIKTWRQSGPSGLDVIRYFEDPSVSFETLKLVHKVVNTRFRKRQKKEREREWSS